MIMRMAGSIAAALAVVPLLLSSGCGPAGEKLLEKAEKEIQRGLEAGFDAADQNGDGRITKAEFAAAEKKTVEDVEETFDVLDDDEDGVLTQDEFRRIFDKVKKEIGRVKDQAAEPKEG